MNDMKTWVAESAALTKPSAVVWCDGSREEYERLVQTMVQDGTLLQLNPAKYSNCYLHRSNPNDVARTEELTFICTSSKDDSGPTNNWLPPDEAKNKLRSYFSGSMKGRTMYVIPYLMGPAGSPYSRIQGLGDAAETPIGFLPTPGSIDTTGLSLNQSAMSKVLSFDKEGWLKESDEIEEFFVQFRNRIPPQIREDIADLKHKLSAQSNP